jgi:bacterial/archaeal transporter family protein
MYGLIAALAWGISTIAAAHAARRMGTYNAVLVSQVLGLTMLVVLTAILRPSLAAVDGRTAGGLAAAGVLGLLGWLSYYRALEHGPVGLVSAVGATYGGVTALLAVAVLGESIGGIGGTGIVLAVGGAAMAAARASDAAPSTVPACDGAAVLTRSLPRLGFVRPSIAQPGIPLALMSALTYGIGAFLLGQYSVRAGWLPSTLVAYTASVLALLLALPFLGKPMATGSRSSGLMWAAAAGVTEVAALLAFSRGGQVGEVAVTAAVSSLYPALALAAGIVMFRERLSSRQVVGVSCIAAGVVMLSLA